MLSLFSPPPSLASHKHYHTYSHAHTSSIHRPSIAGSGSTYIYGYCDSEFKEGMSKEECLTFVKNGPYIL